MRKALSIGSFVLLVLLLSVRLVWSWGTTGHSYINRNATKHLPSEMQVFISQAEVLARYASEADRRKSADPTESPKHYLDIDSYPEFLSGTLTHNLDSLKMKYGNSTVTSRGLLPWATAWAVDSLTEQMKRGNWAKAFLTAADLGHYVADGHQPLHATMNYDPGGLHSRYESTLIDKNISFFTTVAETVTYISSPVDYAFEYIHVSWSLVAPLIRADSLAKIASGGSTSSNAYYDALWTHSQSFTQDQFQRATVAFASLIYTAWVNAERPDIQPTSVPRLRQEGPQTYLLEQNYPNPFNPTTLITYHLPASGYVHLKVLNLLGHEVATLVDETQSAGTHSVTFDGSGLPSGIYFYQLRVEKHFETRRMVLLK